MAVSASEAPSPALVEQSGRSPRWLVAALVALLAVPMVLAAVSLRDPRWYPTLDLAMTELRVRDVGTADTPLIGLPGRINVADSLERQGSHPGPLSFYALAPGYRLLGSSAWALQVSSLVVALAAMATGLALARRRGGTRLVLATALLMAALMAGFGLSVLAEPWNPHLPIFWFLAFVLACWGIAVRDWWVLPVAVLAGSFCAQTHLPYLGLCVGLGLGSLALGLVDGRWRPGLAAAKRPLLVALGCAALVWAPVVVDQLTADDGNAAKIYHHLTEPPEEPVGVRTGVEVMLVHLDLRGMSGLGSGGSGSFVDSSYDPNGTIVPGLLVLGAWVVAAVATWRLGLRSLFRLHLVVAGALALGVVSAGNIFGIVWFYLTLWAWVLASLVVYATAATAVAVVERRLPVDREAGFRRLSTVGLSAALVVTVVGLTVVAPRLEEPAPRLSSSLGALVGPTAEALRDGVGDADGPEGRYVVTWSDAAYIGSQGYGLVSELERDGLDVGVQDWAGIPATEHRVIPPEEVTAVVNFASGSNIARWLAKPGVVEVAHVDPRSDVERAEYEHLEASLLADLERSGSDDLLELVGTNLFGVSLDPRLTLDQRERIDRMLELGLPISVFVAPPDVNPF